MSGMINRIARDFFGDAIRNSPKASLRCGSAEDKIIQAYKSIFTLDKENINLIGVKDMGYRKTELKEKVYKFLGIFMAPSGSNTNVVVLPDQMTMLRNHMQKDDEIPSKDVTHEVRWKVELKNGKKKTKRFNFACSLSPQTVYEFEVIDGVYYILAEVFGCFY